MIAAMMCFLTFQTFPGLVGGALLAGLATGGVTPIWTTMAAHGYGARSFGRMMGIQNPMHTPITATSAPLAGWISDTTGAYDLVFIWYAGLATIALTALYFLRQPVPRVQ